MKRNVGGKSQGIESSTHFRIQSTLAVRTLIVLTLEQDDFLNRLRICYFTAIYTAQMLYSKVQYEYLLWSIKRAL